MRTVQVIQTPEHLSSGGKQLEDSYDQSSKDTMHTFSSSVPKVDGALLRHLSGRTR